MSVRVVARIRPLLKAEIEKDVIVSRQDATIRLPNPKQESELYSFQFSSVFDQTATQAEIFDGEVAPTVKHLFKGYDVTLFAYGVTGTGKTHTMRGGKSLADRGLIPRMLSSIYRRARKVEKDTAETDAETTVEVVMSYYEIYNDRVFDLFEAPEKRTPAGLPIRDNQSGKAVVVGLTERPCTSLKEFEQLYDQANLNRSTSATKLNAHSSRSHAVLCVKVTQTTGNEVRVSTASAIDLAGSEDNRRTDNNKERLVESASINKSLFVLASCVEAISKKQTRIPYRESKMTRILALGQNNGLTVMILNLAPVRSYHLDTLSSLNFANRTKKIEVNEIENQPFFRDQPAGKSKLDGGARPEASLNRQPLRPKILSQHSHLRDVAGDVPKPTKQFAVYTDKAKAASKPGVLKSPKRTSSEAMHALAGRPTKLSKTGNGVHSGMSTDAIEALIERKVTEALAGRTEKASTIPQPDVLEQQQHVSDEVQKRLDALERRVEGQETERAEGLQYLLMAKQHQVRGEDVSALKMYQLALPHFPGNEKLMRKVVRLQDKVGASKTEKEVPHVRHETSSNIDAPEAAAKPTARRKVDPVDASYHEAQASDDEDANPISRPRTKIRRPHHPVAANLSTHRRTTSPPPGVKHSPPPEDDSDDELAAALTAQTPRTRQLLEIINTKDVSRIKLLKGVGAKKAEAIVNCLCDLEDGEGRVVTLGQLGMLRGVGVKTVENMRSGL